MKVLNTDWDRQTLVWIPQQRFSSLEQVVCVVCVVLNKFFIFFEECQRGQVYGLNKTICNVPNSD